MPRVQIDEQVFQAVKRRAVDGGYSSVDAYIAQVVADELRGESRETPNLDHLFTPQLVSELKAVSEKAKSGGKTHSSEEVRQHVRNKSTTAESHSG